MGITDRKKRQKEEVRSQILSTAWAIVKEEGWQSLSIRRIAEAIEYSVPIIYEHFENKEAILNQFGMEGYRMLAKVLKTAKDKDPDPARQLQSMALAYWNFAQKNKEHYQLMFGVGMACCEGKMCGSEKKLYKDLMMEPIMVIISNKKNTDTNPCLKFHTFWSILHGLVSIRLTGNSEVSNDLNKMVLEDAISGFIKNLN